MALMDLLAQNHPTALGQTVPVYSHYFVNPSVNNPGEVGLATHGEVFLSHHRQWMGFEGAPVSATLNCVLPTNGKLAFGGLLSNDRRGLLTSNALSATAAYRLQLGSEQFLSAGLRIGAANTSLDLSRIDATQPSDPAFYSAGNHGLWLDVGAGFAYHNQGFRGGVALPALLGQKRMLASTAVERPIAPLRQVLVAVSYRFSGMNLDLEPGVIYYRSSDFADQIQLMTVAYWRESLWLGAAWRLNSAASAVAGWRFKQAFSLGYAYAFAAGKSSGPGNATHGLLVSLRMGKEKKRESHPPRHQKKPSWYHPAPLPKKKATVKPPQPADSQENSQEKKTAQQEAAQANQSMSDTTSHSPRYQAREKGRGKNKRTGRSLPSKKEKKPKRTHRPGWLAFNRNDTVPAATGSAPGNQEADTTRPGETDRIADQANFERSKHTIQATDSGSPLEINKGYYVVVGSFAIRENAVNYVKQLRENGFSSAEFKYSSATRFNYVFVLRSENEDQARAMWMQLRQTPGFEDTWINTLIVE